MRSITTDTKFVTEVLKELTDVSVGLAIVRINWTIISIISLRRALIYFLFYVCLSLWR